MCVKERERRREEERREGKKESGEKGRERKRKRGRGGRERKKERASPSGRTPKTVAEGLNIKPVLQSELGGVRDDLTAFAYWAI